MTRLKDKYKNEVVPKLMEKFGIKNVMAVPKVARIVISIGMGDAKDNSAVLEKGIESLAALSGQKPAVTAAKRSISTFKLSKGNKVGVMATLRGERMCEFLDKLITIVLPKVRDFRGVPASSFDNQGNFSLGLTEQAIFPEVGFQSGVSGGKTRGLGISIVTTAKNREQGRILLELLGMPFKKN